MSMQPSSATDPGSALVAALVESDFGRLVGTLAPDVRMRALIPPGLVELSGAEAAAAKFASWFGDAEELELIRSGSDTFADRLHVFYRLRVTKPGTVPKLVEQHLLCAIDGDRIDCLDLVCTGFRPDEESWMAGVEAGDLDSPDETRTPDGPSEPSSADSASMGAAARRFRLRRLRRSSAD